MPRIAFWLLAGANFSVALGYGAIVPLLPTVLASYGSADALLSWHTGGLLGAYMLGLFFAAPVWGALSDRIGGQRLLVFGLGAYAASLVAFAGAGDLPTAYLWRVLAGAAGGAVLPIVNATVGAMQDHRERARAFSGTSMATLLGLLAGPAVSAAVYGAMQRMGDVREMTRTVVGLPLAAAAVVAVLVALGCALRLGGTSASTVQWTGGIADAARTVWRSAWPALAASFLLTLALGAFEAVLPVFLPRVLSAGPQAVGTMLALCMVAMLAVQGGLLVFPVLHRVAGGVFVVAAFLAVAAGLALLAASASWTHAALAVGLIGVGGALLQPTIAYLATLNDDVASGLLLGAVSAAGGLGQAVGSLSGGALFALFEAQALWASAAAVAVGALWLGITRPKLQAQRSAGSLPQGRPR
jgi:MFS transporter, DHA1 family, multidrug resistance protein